MAWSVMGFSGILEAETQFHIDAGDGDRQMPADRDLSEECARKRDLRYVADTKRSEPGLRLREALD